MKLKYLQEQIQSELLNQEENKVLQSELSLATKNFSIEQRWNVYRYAVMARMVESLQDDFPVLTKILGENSPSFFSQYIRSEKLNHSSLSTLGFELTEFLKRKNEHKLSDLARFEYFLLQAEQLENSVVSPLSMPVGNLETVVIHFNQNILFSTFENSVTEVYESETLNVVDEAETVAFWRFETKTSYERIGKAEYDFLVHPSASLLSLVDVFEESLSLVLNKWSSNGWIQAIGNE